MVFQRQRVEGSRRFATLPNWEEQIRTRESSNTKRMQSKRDNEFNLVWAALERGKPQSWNGAHKKENLFQHPKMRYPSTDVA